MLAGGFAEAARMFDALSLRAPDEVGRALALEQRGICLEWVRRGLVFVRRQDVGESALTAKAADERTTDEIAVLYSTSVLYGVGTGGWLATLTEPETAAGFVLPSLGLAATSAAAIYALDNLGPPLRYGVPQSIVSGMYIGLGEGVVWSLWNHARTDRADEWAPAGIATMIWGMTTVGALAGGLLGTVQGTTPGRASFVGSAALWTGGVAGLVAGAITPDPDEEYRDDNGLFAAAIGLNAGAVAGILAAGPISPSIARVRFIDLGGAAGALLAGGLYWAAANDDIEPRPFMGTLAIGMTAGLAGAFWLTSGMQPDRWESAGAPATGVETSYALVPTEEGASLAMSGRF